MTSSDPERPDATVIVPTLGRDDWLARTLDDLCRQVQASFEIVVLDQNEEPAETRAPVLHSALHDRRVRWLRLPGTGVVRARNLGIHAARGWLIVFVDDDVEIEDPGFLAKHVAAHHADEGKRLAAVCGRETNPGGDEFVHELTYPRTGPMADILHFPRNYAQRVEAVVLSTCNCSVTRAALLDVGSFDERFGRASYGDDADLALRLVQHDYRVVYDPAPTLLHLRAPRGGLRLSGARTPSSYSDSERVLSSVVFYLKHVHRQHPEYRVPYIYRYILRKTILLRDNALHPWREPQVLIGLLRAILLARRSLREPSPPHCLYLVPSLPGNTGGIERHEVAVCRALADLSFSIEVLSIHGASGEGAIPGTSQVTVRGHRSHRAALVWAAIGAALRRGPRLVLVEHVNLAPLGWLLARGRGAPFVVFTHGLEVWDRLPVLRRWALSRADRVLCVSRYTADHVIAVNGVPAPKVRVVYNCLDPAFAGQAPRHAPSQELRILTVSRLWRADGYKGHAEIMRAVAELRDRYPGLVYDVVGDGDGRSDLEALAAALHLTDVVRFRGRVTEAELRQLYADADAFVMTSTGEGFGLVFVEAMAQGTPVIAARTDATPEVVADGETGLLVDSSSHEQLVEALCRILGDAPLRERMGRAAARRAREVFGFDRFRQSLERSLAELRVA